MQGGGRRRALEDYRCWAEGKEARIRTEATCHGLGGGKVEMRLNGSSRVGGEGGVGVGKSIGSG